MRNCRLHRLKLQIIQMILLVVSSWLVTNCHAEESITITTYYPSPYGSYNELEVYRSVRYRPVDKDTLTNPQEGELVYNDSDDKFYYYNGSSNWTPQGGGIGENVMYLRGRSDNAVWFPAGCPSGWSEADYKIEFAGVDSNKVRTCYRCS